MLSILRLLLLIVVLSSLAGCSADQRGLERYEYAQIIMGVEGRITLYAPDEQTARDAARAAFQRMVELEAVMSDYRTDSELTRVCRTAGTERVPISDDFYRVLARAQAVSAASGGAFDVTAGPLVRLWRQARQRGRLPDPDALEEAKTRVGWRHLLLHDDPPRLQLERPGMQLDLGGIGKGFAADEALDRLRRLGRERCLIDLGGDVRLGAPPPGRAAWRVAIPAPDADGRVWIIELAEAGIATSGDREQYTEIDGHRYSHIVDPETGLGLTRPIMTTVIAPDAATADALASAVSVLGPGDGLALVGRFDGASALIQQPQADGVRRTASEDFPRPLGE